MYKEIFIILGLGLMIGALVGKVKAGQLEFEVKAVWARCLIGCVGLFIGALYWLNPLILFSPRADVEVSKFDVRGTNECIEFIARKTERNIAEIFHNSGHKVVAPTSALSEQSLLRPRMTLSGSVSVDGDFAVLQIMAIDNEHKIISSAELKMEQNLLKDYYKDISEALMYGMNFDILSMKKLPISAKDKVSLDAYVLYLASRRAYQQGEIEDAVGLLRKAIERFPTFAVAYTQLDELLEQNGDNNAAAEAAAMAQRIDPDHNRVVAFANPQMAGEPVQDLTRAINVSPRYKDKDMECVDARSSAFGLHVFAMFFNPTSYSLEILEQSSPLGISASDSGLPDAILTVNGGFFDIDAKRRISTSGLLIVNSVTRNNQQNKLSGALTVISHVPNILWAKDVGNLKQYTYLLQAGPLLIEPGGLMGIKRNDFNRLNRTALCKSGVMIGIVVVSGHKGIGLSLFELASLLKTDARNGGFGCDTAINLDGGPSTQYVFHHGSKKSSESGLWRVNNLLLIKPR